MAKKKSHKKLEEEDSYLSALYKARYYAEEQYDRLIVYLASGALVLTVGFIEDIVDIDKINNFFPLYLSWSCFVASLLIILISHRTCIFAMDSELNGETSKSDCWDLITKFLNWTSLLALIFGIVSFIAFVIAAFPKEGG